MAQQFGLGSARWFFCSLLGLCMCFSSAGGWLVWMTTADSCPLCVVLLPPAGLSGLLYMVMAGLQERVVFKAS